MITTICLKFFLVFIIAKCVVLTESFVNLNQNNNEIERDKLHGIVMGKVFHGCDDAKNNLSVDWDESALDYTCYSPQNPIDVNSNIIGIEECDKVPNNYYPQHHCLNETITYNHSLPTFGDHRPLWPMFGEYVFVPPQRWLHNVEHGAVIMLYHPCANKVMVSRLRAILVNCIRKHIITPSNHLTQERPLALIAWGCRMTMNWVDKDKVINFIKKNSMKGPEGHYTKEGQYRHYLLRLAQTVRGSDYSDSKICPNL